MVSVVLQTKELVDAALLQMLVYEARLPLVTFYCQALIQGYWPEHRLPQIW